MTYNDSVIRDTRKEEDNEYMSPVPHDRTIDTHMIDANGLTFEVNMCGHGDRLALCLHGFPELAFSWRHQMPLLARLGYRVWAPNLRGYGRTTRPPSVMDYTMTHLVADVVGLINKANAKSVVLIGHDWGGAIAWTLASQQPRLLDKLVVMNMPHPTIFLEGVRRLPQALRSWYIKFFQLPWVPEWLLGSNRAWLIGWMFRSQAANPLNFPPSILDVYRNAACQPGALTAMVNYYRALRYTGVMTQTRSGKPLRVPTLLIWGDADKALDKSLTVGTDQLVESLVMSFLPGISHWVQQDAPEHVNEILETWLMN